jgi:spermidine synthase
MGLRHQVQLSDAWRRRASLALMVASGFAGLGYQIIWTQQCSLWLGHESAAVLAVVTAFFGGLAVGSLALGPRIESSARPVAWYAGCELVVAVWGLLLLFVGPASTVSVLRATGVQPSAGWQWSVAFCSTFFLFLPATTAMGATLPAMERLTTQMQNEGRSISALYASNTFGAVLGVLAAAFWLVPSLGLARSAAACVALNLVCGVTALAVFPRTAAPAPGAPASDHPHALGVLSRLALTGFLGIGYEVLVVRVLSQVTEDTVYTFAMLLAVYLVGTSAGAAIYRRWLERRRDQDVVGDRLFAALAAACLLGMASLWAAEQVKATVLEVLGTGMTAAIGAEAVLAFLAFGPPTIVMGALFSHLGRAANATGISFGRALGVNTLAAAAAPAISGVLAVPALGPKIALALIALGYLAATTRRAWSSPTVWVPAAAALAALFFAPPLVFVEIPDGGHVVSYEEGVMAAVSVVEDADGVARLRINNRQQEGTSATLRVDARQAWLPLLFHPAPRRALFLGLGTGVTASSAADDPTLDVDAVELLPEVIAASTYFTGRLAQGAAAPRLHVMAADARRYVRATDRRYDVIVSDNFHPARSGSGALHTVEHFEAVRLRLDAGGLFCQWLPLHQLDLDTLRSIVRSFVTVYPHGWAILASNSLETPVIGLLARADDRRFDAAKVRDRLSRVAKADWVASLGLEDDLAVLGSVVAGPAALQRFSANAIANTDDRPVVAYRAPRITYAPDSSPRDRLSALLRELSIEPGELLAPAQDPNVPRRLAAYWVARDRFIESGRDVRPSSRVEEMLAQVREPLLSVLRISPDFRPAYDPLLSMATVLARSDVSSARALLTELTQIQPARIEATRLLSMMSGEADTVGTAAR